MLDKGQKQSSTLSCDSSYFFFFFFFVSMSKTMLFLGPVGVVAFCCLYFSSRLIGIQKTKFGLEFMFKYEECMPF